MIPSFLSDPINTDQTHEKLLEKFGTKPFTAKEFEDFRADLFHHNFYCQTLKTLRKWNAVIVDHQETFTYHDNDGFTYILDDGSKLAGDCFSGPYEIGEYTRNGKEIVGIVKGADIKRTRNYYTVNLGYTPRRYAALKKACEGIQEKIVMKSAEIESLKREIAVFQDLYKNL